MPPSPLKTVLLSSLIATILATILAATIFGGYRLHVLRAKRAATVAFLAEYAAEWRTSDLEYAGQILADFQNLQEQLLTGEHEAFPLLYSANINPAPDVFPDDPAVMTLRWLEEGFNVDGFDLYVNNELKATISGWRAQNARLGDDNVKLFGSHYGRYVLVDIPLDLSPDPRNNRDIVRLPRAALLGNVTIQLRLDEPVGSKVAVLVESSVSSSEQ